jgi:hypothetical protein
MRIARTILLTTFMLVMFTSVIGLLAHMPRLSAFDLDVKMDPLTAIMLIFLAIATELRAFGSVAEALKLKGFLTIMPITACTLRFYEYINKLPSNLDTLFYPLTVVSSIAPTTCGAVIMLGLNIYMINKKNLSQALMFPIMAIICALLGLVGHFTGKYLYEWHMSVNTTICVILIATLELISCFECDKETDSDQTF